MRDPYEVLGVGRSASDGEIKKAYRKLAKELHPDLNPDDQKTAERFKEVSAAYKILGDSELRGKFDRGEIGADGREQAQYHYEYAGGRRAGAGDGFAGFDFSSIDPEDIFGEFFSNMRGARRPQGGPRAGRASAQRKGADRTYKITISFLDAAKGATRRITLPSGKMLDVKIPSGIDTGQQIRLKGQGHPGTAGAAAGDALVEVDVSPHPRFRRDGNDIVMELPLTLPEAVLGARIQVPTIDGKVALKIPKGANNEQKLRLKGKGIAGKGGKRGDQYVVLRIELPPEPDAELEDLVRKWAEAHPYEVRDERLDDD